MELISGPTESERKREKNWSSRNCLIGTVDPTEPVKVPSPSSYIKKWPVQWKDPSISPNPKIVSDPHIKGAKGLEDP